MSLQSISSLLSSVKIRLAHKVMPATPRLEWHRRGLTRLGNLFHLRSLQYDQKDLRAKAAGLNREIIAHRAEYQRNMARVEEFYRMVIGKS